MLKKIKSINKKYFDKNKMNGEKLKKEYNKILEKKGITLISLVITIIILLILVAVSIATLTGENGILIRANDAKTETEEAKEDELRRLTALEAATNLEDTTHTDNSRNEEVEETVTIPAGFAVSQVEGENTIADGLVIIDKNENEFVWVPVENFNEFEREDFGTETQKWWTGIFVVNEPSRNNMYEPKADGLAEDTEVEKMYKSIRENRGFYVGRYEAGTTASSGSGIRGKLVIKKGANVYNNIGFADTDDMTDETGGAVEVAREMYNEEKGDSVTSVLIYGVQWDAIMRWIQNIPNLTEGRYVQDSIGMGWYSDNYAIGNSTHQTGIELDGEKNKVKNIYDLAGNVAEWTMERYGNTNRIARGGSFYSSGSKFPASYRHGNSSSHSYSDIGFRIALYL